MSKVALLAIFRQIFTPQKFFGLPIFFYSFRPENSFFRLYRPKKSFLALKNLFFRPKKIFSRPKNFFLEI